MKKQQNRGLKSLATETMSNDLVLRSLTEETRSGGYSETAAG
jgi:hypothetical protein